MPWSLLPAKDFGAVADCGSRLIRLHRKPLMMHEGAMPVAGALTAVSGNFRAIDLSTINPQLTTHFLRQRTGARMVAKETWASVASRVAASLKL